LREWLEEHYAKLRLLQATLQEMAARLEGFGDAVENRILSEDYLQLVRRTFSQWDNADTDEKRRILVQLITNAAGTRICSDDIIRLFLDWIDTYHEAHFAVIRAIYERRSNPPTRYDIWVSIYGPQLPRDDSAEADLYKMLIRDLSTGGVIRQPRETDYMGRYRTKPHGGPKSASSGVMKSAFDNNEEYVLTELGSQFVHYTMTELVQRLAGRGGNSEPEAAPNS
jgi:GTPase SAR1 family protein